MLSGPKGHKRMAGGATPGRQGRLPPQALKGPQRGEARADHAGDIMTPFQDWAGKGRLLPGPLAPASCPYGAKWAPAKVVTDPPAPAAGGSR